MHQKQHTQSKLLNFKNWFSGELSEIGHNLSNKVISKLILSKNVNNNKCAPKLVLFNEKKMRKIPMIFDIFKVKFWDFLTPPH